MLVTGDDKSPSHPSDSHTRVSARYLRTLCDDTAILQHARGMIPRVDTGYCVDDAGRALPVLARHALRNPADGPDATVWEIAVARNLAFLRLAAGDGSTPAAMRNFMAWDRSWLDGPHAGDHVGRAVWGLGELAAEGLHVDEALELMLDIVAGFDARNASSRTTAYVALGLEAAHWDSRALSKLGDIEQTLTTWRPSKGEWVWFEPRLSYDNARIPEVLVSVGHRLNRDDLIDSGLELLAWLDGLCRQKSYYRFPGHLGLSPHLDLHESGDEQPLEASAMADAHAAAWEVTNDDAHRRAIDRAWSWFLGNNRLGLALGDVATGACHDGLCAAGTNGNCGAESTLAFLRCGQTRNGAGERRRRGGDYVRFVEGDGLS